VDARVASLKEELRQVQKDRESALAAAKKAERRVIGLGAEKSALAARVERLTAAVKEQARFLSEMQANEDDDSESLAPGVAEYRAKQLENLGAATTAGSPTPSMPNAEITASSPLLTPVEQTAAAAAEVHPIYPTASELQEAPVPENQGSDHTASPTTKATSAPSPASSPTLSPRRIELSVSVGATSPVAPTAGTAMANASLHPSPSSTSASSSPPPPPPVEPVTPRTPRPPRPEDSAAAAIAAIMAVVNEQEALEVQREASRARVPSNGDDDDDDDDDNDDDAKMGNQKEEAGTTGSAAEGTNNVDGNLGDDEVVTSSGSSWKLAGPFTFVVGDRVLVRDDPNEEWRAGTVEAVDDDEDDDEGPVVSALFDQSS